MPKVILIANTDWYLYNFRLSLARFLRQEGYEVVLVAPTGRFIQKLQQEGFCCLSWRLDRKSFVPWTEISSVLFLLSLYRREKPDLVHHHTIKPVIYGSLVARIAGVPAVVNSITGRGYVFLSQERRALLLKILVKPLYRMALSYRKGGLIFENQVDRQYFIQERLADEQHTFLIEGVGVDTDIYFPCPEPEGLPVIMLPARLLWDKGVGVLVEAARLLRGKVEARVALVGAPDKGNPNTVDEASLRLWQEEGLIEWWGWHDDMAPVYAQAAIVVLPTMYGEGVPTTLLEAAACAKPIVATDIPGCRAVVVHGRNGYLVPPNDPQSLADALAGLVSDPDLRARMGQQGRQLVVDKYTHRLINTATLGVYRRFLVS